MSPADRHGPTPRQRQIAQLAALGNTTAEISQKLGITVDTVRTQRQNLLMRLGAHSMTHVVYMGMRDGWLT